MWHHIVVSRRSRSSAVDLTATVAPNTAVGTVQFKSNGAAIGSPVTVTGGVATLSHAFDVAGASGRKDSHNLRLT
ncbi:Ig-like domain-containing protein [Rhodococcus sp. C3V]|uniref:Ig-like domain-containing protein n=1 Tax=Rhodococcus sp. C3V TaxID=3034165 RepID=UPI0023E2CA65|nr:Ig-like domain-containing protein [Rhodococcus sp. C3V]MDF3320225.1 Ig-like domain-containing protein [Rhodococcus sp. C3V]